MEWTSNDYVIILILQYFKAADDDYDNYAYLPIQSTTKATIAATESTAIARIDQSSSVDVAAEGRSRSDSRDEGLVV